MASNRRIPAITTAILAVALAVGGAAPAWAEDPVEFGQSPIVDTVGALEGSTDDVLAAIEQTADRTGRQLFVAYVDEFTNPEQADTWANDTAVANNMGSEDYLLAVAVDGRAYYVSAADDAEIPADEIQRISVEVIEPELRDGDWAGAAIAAAEALDTGGSGSSGWGWVWFLVIGALVVAVIAIVLSRRSKRSGSTDATGAAPAGPPAVPLDELRRTAGSALVQADDAMKTSEEELGFATASYGDDATASFRTALGSAKAKVAEAFALQQRLDDATPDSDDERRALYEGIIALTGEADALLDEQAEAFDALRDLERNAPAELERVAAEAAAAQAAIAPAAERVQALGREYAPSAVAAVADNPEQASSRLAFATEALDRARQAVAATQHADAAVSIRAAEEAVDQAALLAGAVDRLAADLEQADRAIASGVVDLEADVVTARALGGSAAVAAERVAAVAAELRAGAGVTGRDPLAAAARLTAADHEIDAAIAGARDAAEQAARAQAMRERAIANARVQVQTAEDYLVARRGAVGTDARTRLASAAQLLQQAQASPDAAAAVEAAQRAERLAAEALSLARSDVEGFGGGFGGGMGGFGGMGGGQGGRSSGGDIMGAVLGGILIDSMLGGGRSSGGGFGGFGGGSGGGFGGFGGGRSGGGRSAGSFGGSATRGRRGSGGRF